MPTDPTTFFEEQKLSSRYKVRLLGSYASPFFYKLGSRYQRIWIVDGFAGPGAYDAVGEGPREDGSPLATARVARQIAESAHKSELRIINVERDPTMFARLEGNLSSLSGLTTNLPGAFAARLDEVLQTIGNDPVLFFIDPFGLTGADIRLIDRILARQSKTITELLINFSFQGFRRMAGNLETRKRSRSRQQAAETKVAELNGMLGSAMWQRIWRNTELSSAQKCERVSELFCNSLRERGIRHVHPIRMRDSFDGPVRYQLLFATRSSHGVYLMSDFACRYERELLEASSGPQLSLMGAIHEQEFRALRTSLKEEIHALGLALERADQEKIRRLLSPTHFGEFIEKDYAYCLRELVTEGGISRADEKGIKKHEPLRFVPIEGQSPRVSAEEIGKLIASDGQVYLEAS